MIKSFQHTESIQNNHLPYLWQDRDAEGLVAVFTHQVERDDREDVPGGGARLPAHQLLTQPKPRRELLSLRGRRMRWRRMRGIFGFRFWV